MMAPEQYLIFVEHSPSSANIFSDARSLGLKVLYLGSNPLLQKESDLYFPLDLGAGVEEFLVTHGPELKRLSIAGAYTFLEHAKIAEFKISQYLGLKGASEAAVVAGRDKVYMRSAMKKSGIPTIESIFIEDKGLIPQAPFLFPFIVKPNLGYASGGVQLVHDEEQFRAAVRSARRLNRFVLGNGYAGEVGVLCEEFIDGPEFAVDGISVNGIFRAFSLCARGFAGAENFQDFLYVSATAAEEESLPEIQTIIELFLSTIGYFDGPTHTELRFCSRRKKWFMIETALRVGFAGLIGTMFTLRTGIPYNQLAIQAYLGLLPAENLSVGGRAAARAGVLFSPAMGSGGKISAIEGLAFLESDSRIALRCLEKKVGDFVVAYPRGLEYLGMVIGIVESEDGLASLLEDLANRVKFIYEKN